MRNKTKHPASSSRFYIYRYKSIISTQNRAKKQAIKGCKEGLVIISETQKKGRGRFERSWSSGKGGLWFSLVLRPCISAKEAQFLVVVVSVAIIEVLNDFTKCCFKKPNDIMILCDNRLKKICGILLETSITNEKIDWAVIGVGINVRNTIPKTLQDNACTLKDIVPDIELKTVEKRVLSNIRRCYEEFLRGERKRFEELYKKATVFNS